MRLWYKFANVGPEPMEYTAGNAHGVDSAVEA